MLSVVGVEGRGLGRFRASGRGPTYVVSPARVWVGGFVDDRCPGGLGIIRGGETPGLPPGATVCRPSATGFCDVVGGWRRKSGVWSCSSVGPGPDLRGVARLRRAFAMLSVVGVESRGLGRIQASGRGPTYVVSPVFDGLLHRIRWSVGLAGDDIDFDAATTFAAAELDDAVFEGEEGVVTAAADVVPRVVVRTALAQDDRSDGDFLTGVALDTTELRIAVTSVTGRTLSFLMCHGGSPFLGCPSAL